jgi:uncharacterized protein (DUF4213/DUF364 family)
MTYATDALALVQALDGLGPLPRVQALHLPPPPATDAMRGEFAALALEDGSLGLSYVLLGDTLDALRRERERMDLAGADPQALARLCAEADPSRCALGFAALNALTRWLFDRAGFEPPPSGDSLGALDPQPGETVGMVGYFTPLIPRITARGARVLVVELRQDLVGERDGVRVTLDTAALAGCDKVLATGTLLLNDTLEGVLAHCRGARALALVGPSVGGPPDPLFGRGVTQLGGSWVTDPAGYVRALQAGESTSACARKFTLAPQDYPGWSALLARAAARRG